MRRLSASTLAFAFAAAVAYAPTVDAEPVPKLPRLPTAKRLELFNKALKVAGQPAIAAEPPGPVAKLSPGQSQDGTSWIAVLGPGTLTGGGTPYFTVMPLSSQPGLPPSAQLQMYFPNEAGKVYVLDCLVGPPPNTDQTAAVTVKLSHPGASAPQQVTSDAGHALVSFVAKTTGSTLITMTTVGTAPFVFRGCELTKVN